MLEENIGKPKVKRKPKAVEEIENSESSIPAKKVKKKKPVEETVEVVEKPALHPHQSVLLIACLNPVVAKASIDSAIENGVEVVILEDRVILDYLENKNSKGKVKSIGDFLNDTSNRLHAEEQCAKLWAILTGGRPIEDADEVVFTRTEVVKKTNLSHSNADKVFQLLRAFGMLEFVKGTHEFRLHFNKNLCHRTIQMEVSSVCSIMNNDILRFKASINSDTSLSDEQKAVMLEELRKSVYENIDF